MMLQEYIDSLPDETYGKCKVTANTITLPVNSQTLHNDFSASVNDTTLTNEKAVMLAAQYLENNKPVVDPLQKLALYYDIKKA